MGYGELGRVSLEVNIKCRNIAFWANLSSVNSDTISRNVYLIIRQMHVRNVFTSKWLDNVKNIPDTCGTSVTILLSNG